MPLHNSKFKNAQRWTRKVYVQNYGQLYLVVFSVFLSLFSKSASFCLVGSFLQKEGGGKLDNKTLLLLTSSILEKNALGIVNDNQFCFTFSLKPNLFGFSSFVQKTEME